MSSMESGGTSGTGQAGSSVTGPAIALMVIGILGVLCDAYFLISFLTAPRDPEAALEQMKEANVKIAPVDEQQFAKFYDSARQKGPAVPGILLLIHLVIAFGAFRMLKLKSYGMAMTSSVLSLVPCISPCCVLGIPFGIWSLIVLMKADVKQAFH
jgi:hypothetical protein